MSRHKQDVNEGIGCLLTCVGVAILIVVVKLVEYLIDKNFLNL